MLMDIVMVHVALFHRKENDLQLNCTYGFKNRPSLSYENEFTIQTNKDIGVSEKLAYIAFRI